MCDTLFLLLARNAEEVGMEIHIGPCRKFFVEGGFLWYGTENLPYFTGVMPDIVAHYCHLAAGGHAQTADHIDSGGFARSIWTEQSEDFSLPHCEGEVIDGLERAKGFREVGHFYGGNGACGCL